MEFHRVIFFAVPPATKRAADSLKALPSSHRPRCNFRPVIQTWNGREIRSRASLMQNRTPKKKNGCGYLRASCPSGNLGQSGAAFDAAALAMDLYITIDARPASDFSIGATGRDPQIARPWRIISFSPRTARFSKTKPPKLSRSRCASRTIFPSARLRLLAAARLAGIALANHFGQMRWTDSQMSARPRGASTIR